MKNSKVRLVLVEWLDSRQPFAAWRKLQDIPTPEPSACVSVGWLILRTHRCIALAPNMADVGSEGNMQASGVIEIPTRAITAIKTIREK